DANALRAAVGSLGEWLQQLARGDDHRPVVSEHEPKSSGSEVTFESDLTNLEEIRTSIAQMASDVASWLERRRFYARTICIKVRYDDFTTITRSHTAPPSRDEAPLVERAVALLARTEAGTRPVRFLGVSVQNLTTSLTTTPPTRQRTPTLPFDAG